MMLPMSLQCALGGRQLVHIEPVALWHCTGFASNAAFCAAPEKQQQLGLAVITWSDCNTL